MNNLHLHLESSGLRLSAHLAPEALQEILALVQRHKVTDLRDAQPPGFRGGGGRGPWRQGRPMEQHPSNAPDAFPLTDDAASMTVKRTFVETPWDALIRSLPSVTFGEKLLLILAWLESRANQPIHKREFRAQFTRTGLLPPSNPSRDLKGLHESGLLIIHSVRYLSLTAEGWQKALLLLNCGGGNDEPGAAVPVA